LTAVGVGLPKNGLETLINPQNWRKQVNSTPERHPGIPAMTKNRQLSRLAGYCLISFASCSACDSDSAFSITSWP
jgi:hypothetical protein